jgi:hypothetical protein
MTKITYVKYRDAAPFTHAAGSEVRMVFRTAGMVIKEDNEFLVMGEVCTKEDNEQAAVNFGSDMFPAYRSVLPIRKEDIVERRDFELKESG